MPAFTMHTREKLQIRRAQLEDAAVISSVLFKAFEEFQSLYSEHGFAITTPKPERVMIRIWEGPVWVAVKDGAVVGTVSAVVKPEAVYVRGMAVLPNARGSGAGTCLMRELEEWASGERHLRLFLSTTPFLKSAIRLYERLGFRRTIEGPHELFGTPLFTMEKKLSPTIHRL
jgi:GNAT superfamily N-acetyltransferase